MSKFEEKAEHSQRHYSDIFKITVLNHEQREKEVQFTRKFSCFAIEEFFKEISEHRGLSKSLFRSFRDRTFFVEIPARDHFWTLADCQ